MRINEIFYSIQGEGANTGEAAVFVRFSGCNLRCAFCDTEHWRHTDMSEEEITEQVAKYPARLVVLTGGEPTLQLTETLIDKLHSLGKRIAVETNGTRPVPKGVDWVTVSPKEAFVGSLGRLAIKRAEEVKIVLDDEHCYRDATCGIEAKHYFVQPCDTSDRERNEAIIRRCIDFVKRNPKWRLSLQTHKILGIR